MENVLALAGEGPGAGGGGAKLCRAEGGGGGAKLCRADGLGGGDGDECGSDSESARTLAGGAGGAEELTA